MQAKPWNHSVKRSIWKNYFANNDLSMEHPLSRLSAFSLFRNTALSRMNLHLPFKPHLHSKLFLLYSCPSSSLSKAALHNAFNNQGGLIRRSFSGQCSIHIDCTLSSSSSSSPSKYFNHPSFKNQMWLAGVKICLWMMLISSVPLVVRWLFSISIRERLLPILLLKWKGELKLIVGKSYHIT